MEPEDAFFAQVSITKTYRTTYSRCVIRILLLVKLTRTAILRLFSLLK